MRTPHLVPLCLALGFASLAAFADAPPNAQFEAALDVRVVNVEAVVTDQRGHRVPDLKAADFVLLVDGKEVPIDYFSEVRDGETVQSSTEVETTPLAPSAASASAPATINYLVFIDESFLIAAQRDFVLLRMLRDLGKMGPVDRMAVISFDGRRLTRLVDWTMDRAALESTFKTAMLRPTQGIAKNAERRSENSLGQSDGADTITSRANGAYGESYAPGSAQNGGLQVANDYGPVGKAILAAAASMRGMSNPPGRKVLFILTGGWPIPTGSIAGTLDHREFLQANANADLKVYYRPLTEAANLLGYSVYPVDVAGHDTAFSWVDSFNPGPTDITRLLSTDFEMAVDAGLEQIAQETGGKAILNSARLNAFERAATDTKSYYGLGFSPTWQADGSHHDIELRVRRPGMKVRARKEFSDLRQETEVALRNESLLFFGGEESTRRLRLVAGAPSKAGFGKVEVPIEVEMPLGALTALPAAGGTLLQGILSMEALDRWGKRTALGMIQLRITGSGDATEGGTARYEARVVLPKGDQHLVFILRDGAGEGESWGALDLKAAVRR